ncbi:MAG: ead/Ea22-like family protein [Klebsiella aerogenes]|nr:ead/Ea22-like family protein [Klebsiella aerogenes]
MTDITELAQSMKAAAEKASNGDWIKESGDGWEACCSANDQANGGFIIAHFEGPDAAENREFAQAANPANIRALVEALEKAQTKAIEQGRTACELFDEVTTLRQRIASLEESHAQVIQSRDHYKRMLEEGLEQLAEPRTVTVKLPAKIERNDIDGWLMYKGGRIGGGAAEWYNKALDDVGAELTATGIKVEAE